MKMLIIEDELKLAQSIATYLASEKYRCEIVSRVDKAKEKLELYDYDCILLDISLADGNGLVVLDKLKELNKLDGVLIISARNSLEDRVTGLKKGADDYLTKPFHMAELSARIAAIIRRRKFDGKDVIQLGEIIIDIPAMQVSVKNKKVDLTRKEYDLLLFLISNRNRVISKNAIAEHLNGDRADLLDNFDFIYAHMKNLKKKLTEAGCEDYIKSIYGLGYKMEA